MAHSMMHTIGSAVSRFFERKRIEKTRTELLTLDEVNQRYVRQVLAAVGGNKTRAAQILGIDRRSIYRRLEPTTPNS